MLDMAAVDGAGRASVVSLNSVEVSLSLKSDKCPKSSRSFSFWRLETVSSLLSYGGGRGISNNILRLVAAEERWTMVPTRGTLILLFGRFSDFLGSGLVA